MTENGDRPDFRTRYKEGQSGNLSGRPKGCRNVATLVRDALYEKMRVNDGGGVRTLPKIVVATKICLNKALKGDARSYVKIMEIAERFGLFQAISTEPEITRIERVIIYPDGKEEKI
jgi:hypothetical protein